MEPVTAPLINQQVQLAVRTIKEYIDSHPLDWTGIDDFSNLGGFNRKLLQRAFKQEYNVTISDYQLKKRMEYAAENLATARVSKKQISAKCGYQNQSGFTRAFRKVFSCSPREWQKEFSQPRGLIG